MSADGPYNGAAGAVVLRILFGLALVAAAVASFVMIYDLRRRVTALEEEVGVLFKDVDRLNETAAPASR